MKYRVFIVLFLVFGLCSNAGAVLKVRVTQSANDAQPIAVVPFNVQAKHTFSTDVASVIQNDLASSGEFRPLPNDKMLSKPTIGSRINYANWRKLNMPYLVVGKVEPADKKSNKLAVSFQLINVNTTQQMLGFRYVATPKSLRKVAHRISDEIYQKITQHRGTFSTRIAYVSVTRKGKQSTYRLQIADADGHNPRTLVKSKYPLMSPTWSPNGQQLAYVSFRNRNADIYSIDLKTGTETPLAKGKGINGAPSFSPNGQQLAFTSSKGGSPDLYVMDLSTRQTRQITRGYSIETEPEWSHNGRQLFFTSSRTGNPQIYKVSATGGALKRMTFDGRYNASPSNDVSGRFLALVHRQKSAYRIALLDTKYDQLRVLTRGKQDESPSFSPNGRRIVYASQEQGRGILKVVSVDARTQQQLLLTEGDIREPAWSPF